MVVKVVDVDYILHELYEKIQDGVLKYVDDYVTVITGHQASGKSTLGIWLTKKLTNRANKLVQKNVDFSKSIVFTAEDYLKRETELPAGYPMMFDEAVYNMFSREAMKKFNRIIAKVFVINRFRQHVHFLVIPQLHWIDKYIREARMNAIIYLYKQHVGIERYRIGYWIPRKALIRYILRYKRWHLYIQDWEWLENKLRPKQNVTIFKFELPDRIFEEIWDDDEFRREYHRRKSKIDEEIRKEIDTKNKITIKDILKKGNETKVANSLCEYFRKIGDPEIATFFEALYNLNRKQLISMIRAFKEEHKELDEEIDEIVESNSGVSELDIEISP